MVRFGFMIAIIFSPFRDQHCNHIWSLFAIKIAIIFGPHRKKYCNLKWSSPIYVITIVRKPTYFFPKGPITAFNHFFSTENFSRIYFIININQHLCHHSAKSKCTSNYCSTFYSPAQSTFFFKWLCFIFSAIKIAEIIISDFLRASWLAQAP